jgi:hypothetical protein
MEENRLHSLALLNIEADLTKTINFNVIIKSFAWKKCIIT